MSAHVAIIGGGVIGAAWAARFALNGHRVRVHDTAPDAEPRLQEVFRNARRALPMLYERALPSEADVEFAPSLQAAVDGAIWVQESLPERIDLKHAVYREVEQVIAPDVPIASSTSGYRPAELAEGSRHPGRIIVAHPFNPVYLLPLVELVGGDRATVQRAGTLLRSVGMHPLHLHRENDAHIADRLLEAVWREALWLVRDGYASTAEIDDAIRYGFGLRWAQMGLFETYRIAGGEGGMAHFIEQFGPCLRWPWTKLTDVPELTDDLVARIARQSDEQSGQLDVRQLERLRDDNLVAILRALKGQGAAAGALIRRHELELPSPLRPAGRADRAQEPFLSTVRRSVPVDWTDYNGHMNESRYGQVFSDAADVVLELIGCGADYVSAGHSWFTVETTTRFMAETLAAQRVTVRTRVDLAQGRKLRLVHEMRREASGGDAPHAALQEVADADVGEQEVVLARCDQLLLHVSLSRRKSCDPDSGVAARLAQLAHAHADRADRTSAP